MNEVVEFLKKIQTYYLATVDADGNPRVRPFGTAHEINGRLALQTGLVKDVAKQLQAHPTAEICGFDPETGTWLRVFGELTLDDRIEAQEEMLEAYPELKAMYAAGDGNTAIFSFEPGAVATFSSFTAPPRTIEL